MTSCCTYRSMHHSAPILLPQMGTNPEAHNWTLCTERDFEALRPKWGVFTKSVPMGLRNLCGRGDERSVRDIE